MSGYGQVRLRPNVRLRPDPVTARSGYGQVRLRPGSRTITAAGSVLRGISSFKLVAVPQQPEPPSKVAAETDDTQISVSFGETMPDNGGAEIINTQLYKFLFCNFLHFIRI